MSDGNPGCVPGLRQANKWAKDADGRRAAVLSALVMFGASYAGALCWLGPTAVTTFAKRLVKAYTNDPK